MTDAQKLVAEGEAFVKNAEDALARQITTEDQLYIWDNQVEVIDLYLADTETVEGGHPDLRNLRNRLRDVKQKLEKQSIELQAKLEGIELPEDGKPDEIAEEYAEFGKEFVQMAKDALKEKVNNVTEMERWEVPYTTLSGFLADTEPYKSHAKVAEMREKLRADRAELKQRMDDLLRKWRESDMAGGEGEEEGGE